MGRLLEKQGKTKEAIAAYTAAIETLKSVRSELFTINPDVQFSFRDQAEPVYRELVDFPKQLKVLGAMVLQRPIHNLKIPKV